MAASVGMPSGFSFGFYYFEDTDTVNTKRELSYQGERHILLFGVNRSGKSTRLLLKNLARIQNRSTVVLDIKGELCFQTRRVRQKICGAENVKTVNPYNLHELGSDGFNPLACLNPDDDLFYDKARRLTSAIVEQTGEKDPHWTESAMGLLTAGIMWEVIESRIEARPPSLLKVRQFICARDEWEEVPPVKKGRTLVPQPPRQVKGLKVNCELMAREGGEQIAGLISRFLREHGQNELAGIQSTFDTQTEFLISIPIARDLEKGNWSFAQLRETPTTVYIMLPPEEIKDKRRWTRLLFTCALNEHLKAGPVSTLFILDEFRVAVANLEIINTLWSLVAGYGVQFLVVCQSALHLKALFKEEWEIYAGQAGAVVTIGPPNDRPTAEWMSKRAGLSSQTRVSQNEGQGVTQQGISTSDGTTVSEADVAFKTPEELMSIPVGTGRIWTPGRGNTSIPYFAPNYWKLKNVRDLIDKNPLYNGPSPPPTGSALGKITAAAIGSRVGGLRRRAFSYGLTALGGMLLVVLFSATMAAVRGDALFWSLATDAYRQAGNLASSAYRQIGNLTASASLSPQQSKQETPHRKTVEEYARTPPKSPSPVSSLDCAVGVNLTDCHAVAHEGARYWGANDEPLPLHVTRPVEVMMIFSPGPPLNSDEAFVRSRWRTVWTAASGNASPDLFNGWAMVQMAGKGWLMRISDLQKPD